MNRSEADELGKRIINAWRGGVPLTEWIEELERLDAGQAGTTFVRLKRTLEHSPSIAKFLAEYHALDTHDASNRPQRCGHCSDSGWVESQPYVSNGDVYSGVQPCDRCSEGAQRKGSRLWADAPRRDFISEAEAARLIAARLPGAA